MTGPVDGWVGGSVGRWIGAVVGVVLLVVSAAGCTNEEQGGLQGASPGPGAVVGGEIDRIELLYDDIIVSADGSVTDPDGDELDATFVVDSDIRAVVDLAAPLDPPGEYTVRHVVGTADGDRVEASYSFTYDPAASPPRLVFPPEDTGPPWLLWTVAVVGLIVIGVLGWRLLRSMARVRRMPER